MQRSFVLGSKYVRRGAYNRITKFQKVVYSFQQWSSIGSWWTNWSPLFRLEPRGKDDASQPTMSILHVGFYFLRPSMRGFHFNIIKYNVPTRQKLCKDLSFETMQRCLYLHPKVPKGDAYVDIAYMHTNMCNQVASSPMQLTLGQNQISKTHSFDYSTV